MVLYYLTVDKETCDVFNLTTSEFSDDEEEQPMERRKITKKNFGSCYVTGKMQIVHE